MNRHALPSVLIALAVFSLTASAAEEQKIWGGLILGGAELSVEGGDSGQFRSIKARLSKDPNLKFAEYVLLGEETQTITKDFQTWVVPSREIFLELNYKGSGASGIKLFLSLWHKKEIKTKADVVLKPDEPLLIRGPQWKGGYLIFALDLVE